MNRAVVYETSATDPVNGLPIVVIDSTALPVTKEAPSLDTDVPNYVSMLPKSNDFVLLVLASRGFKNQQLSWLQKVHSMLERSLKKRIKRVIIVHAKWYTKALNKTLAPILSPKFAKKQLFLNNLTELSRHIDITNIDISPHVYLADLDLKKDPELHLGHIPVPKTVDSIFGKPLTVRKSKYWDAALTYLTRVELNEHDFEPFFRLEPTDQDLFYILKHAVEREQRLRLADYGPVPVLHVLKEYMFTLPKPLVDINLITHPVVNSKSYIDSVLERLPKSHLLHITQLIIWMQQISEYIEPGLIAKSMGPAIMRIRHHNKEDLAIASSFTRLLIHYYDEGLPELPKRPSRAFSHSNDSNSGLLFGSRQASACGSAIGAAVGPTNGSTSGSVNESADNSRSLSISLSGSDTVDIDTESELDGDVTELDMESALKIESIYNSKPEFAEKYEFSAATESKPARIRPRDLPSEIREQPKAPKIPHRKAYGKIAEIIKAFDEQS